MESARFSVHPVKNVNTMQCNAVHRNAMSYDSYYAAQQDLA